MNTIIQYIFTGFVFLFAVFYVIKMIKDARHSKNPSLGGCKNCEDEPSKEDKK